MGFFSLFFMCLVLCAVFLFFFGGAIGGSVWAGVALAAFAMAALAKAFLYLEDKIEALETRVAGLEGQAREKEGHDEAARPDGQPYGD